MEKQYKSTIVFPICVDFERYALKGFLAFDSINENFFGEIPETFDYTNNVNEFHKKAEQCAIYHIGSSLANHFAVVFAGIEAVKDN
ncbi:hypothetical protein L21SP3_01564 [Sedimentisphaera cyanobacteriorum]|uniref:Uncharacterized protein n=1 Tax=Sedimentisphaera cyanobacteriorum TaxID=1940790 RepID=A0A1Q2HQR5_9BACT|nr:hypothetical protein [Sedimentisphaera cyanobacteriorum]AQQ09752.1 hypothetical protein L21SP3_01564 [Sedimentisphaera cyanobacteriorum]